MKRQICLTASILFLSAAMLPGRAQNATPLRGQPAAPVTANMRPHTVEKVVVPELTEVPIVLKDLIHSDTKLGVGTELLFFVAKDVYGPGHTLLIARGTPALGQIARAHPSAHSGREKLCLRCDYILAQDKTRIPLTGVHQEVRSDAQNDESALIGQIDVGATVDLFQTGKDSRLPVGKTYSVYVNADTQTEAPLPNLEPDDNSGKQQEAFVLLKDGTFAVGVFRRRENTYVLTNAWGTQTVKIADVISLEFLKDVHVPYHID